MPRKSTTSITAIKHSDKRANIPTEELRDFIADEERAPKQALYPRDPSLDPQLVWKGKDEQDQKPLEVPAVPVYIQEKIQPSVIIDQVRAEPKQDAPDQLAMFSDFNGINFEDLIDFYQHEQNWTNRMILGDSLLVMTSLAEKEGLKGKVQMIYLDPPYGIKFGSNWQVSTRKRDVKDGKAEDLTRQSEQIKAFRDTWELGIHSYLSYLRDRLTVARELLTESGSVFVQISDENVHLVRCVLDEVFGSENFCNAIHFKSTTSQTSELLAEVGDYILWFAKKHDEVKYRQLFRVKDTTPSEVRKYAEFDDGSRRVLETIEQEDFSNLQGTPHLYVLDNITSQSGGDTTRVPFSFQDRRFIPDPGFWKTNLTGLGRLGMANRLGISGKTLRYVRFIEDFPVSPVNSLWTDTSTGSFTESKVYVVQTNVKVIERCLLMTTDPGDLVIDPTCGSGTTAYVAEQWGRRWITIDTSRVAIALARTRLMAARYPYYLLADSPDGSKKEMELSGNVANAFNTASGDQSQVVPGKLDTNLQSPISIPQSPDIRRGFVYKRVPHITLKSIANNTEIDDIHARWQPQLDVLRIEINSLAGRTWEEWEIPRELPADVGQQQPTRSRKQERRTSGQRRFESQVGGMVARAAGAPAGDRCLDCTRRRYRVAVRSAVRGQ
jgi:adenine-specific DNA-methyltransferase